MKIAIVITWKVPEHKPGRQRVMAAVWVREYTERRYKQAIDYCSEENRKDSSRMYIAHVVSADDPLVEARADREKIYAAGATLSDPGEQFTGDSDEETKKGAQA